MLMRTAFLRIVRCLSVLLTLNVVSLSAQNFQLVKLGTFAHGSFDQAGAEIGAYDPATKRAFVTNGARKSVDVLNLANPASPSFLFLINLSPRSANSVAFPGWGVGDCCRSGQQNGSRHSGVLRRLWNTSQVGAHRFAT